jgi:hypothetical protein
VEDHVAIFHCFPNAIRIPNVTGEDIERPLLFSGQGV